MKASTNRWQVTACSGISCSLQTRRPHLYWWPAGLWKSVVCILVDLRPNVWSLITVSFADMMYQLSRPFSGKTPVETDLTFCTSSPRNIIAYNVFMTLVWLVQLTHYYLLFCKYISGVVPVLVGVLVQVPYHHNSNKLFNEQPVIKQHKHFVHKLLFNIERLRTLYTPRTSTQNMYSARIFVV